MKKIIVLSMLVFFFGSLSTNISALPIHKDTLVSPTDVTASMKIKNDTGSKIRIHTGSGVVTLQKGSSTSISCKVGKKVHTAPKGVKDKFLFKITSKMCGKTVKLSKYL